MLARRRLPTALLGDPRSGDLYRCVQEGTCTASLTGGGRELAPLPQVAGPHSHYLTRASRNYRASCDHKATRYYGASRYNEEGEGDACFVQNKGQESALARQLLLVVRTWTMRLLSFSHVYGCCPWAAVTF